MFLKAESLFFPDLGTVINIKRKQWIPTSAGVSFILNCSPPACWEYCSCLLFGKFQESYLYPLCEGLLAGYTFPCAWLQRCANWSTGEAKPQPGSPEQSPGTQSPCTVQDILISLCSEQGKCQVFHPVDILFSSIGKRFFTLHLHISSRTYSRLLQLT